MRRALKILYISYVIAAISWLILFPVLLLACKINTYAAALPIFIFNGLLIGFMKYRTTLASARSDWDFKLKEKTAIRENSTKEFEALSADESTVREKELAIATLYEITKRMSATLSLDDIFDIFSAYLKGNFMFRRSELIILKEADERFRVIGTRKACGDGESVRPYGGNIDYDAITEIFSKNIKEIYATRKEDGDIFEKLRVDKDVRTFAAVPLLSENHIVGILTIEDLPHIDFERFVILAMQFSLEIKKVLLYGTVEELAITDALTGLYVRRYFFERLGEELNRSSRYDFKFAFLMIDIDDFKNCNDTYGHLVGDVVLRDAARIIKESVREIDLVARYGGEEFSIFLPETQTAGAKLAAERIRKKIEENVFHAYDEKLKVTVSIGISIYPDNSDEANSLVEKADRALYEAKGLGKNIVCIYER